MSEAREKEAQEENAVPVYLRSDEVRLIVDQPVWVLPVWSVQDFQVYVHQHLSQPVAESEFYLVVRNSVTREGLLLEDNNERSFLQEVVVCMSHLGMHTGSGVIEVHLQSKWGSHLVEFISTKDMYTVSMQHWIPGLQDVTPPITVKAGEQRHRVIAVTHEMGVAMKKVLEGDLAEFAGTDGFTLHVDTSRAPSLAGQEISVSLPRRNSADGDVPLEFCPFDVSAGSQPEKDESVKIIMTKPRKQGEPWPVLTLCYYDSNANLWKRELSPVYYQIESDTVSFELTHFSEYRLAIASDSVILDEDRINHTYDRAYNDEVERDVKFLRGGLPYYLPMGFTRIGVLLPEEKKICFKWPVAYHGTRPGFLGEILDKGLQIRAPLAGHVPVEKGEKHLIPKGVDKPFKGKWAEAIFATPSYRYAAWYGLYRNSTGVACLTSDKKIPVLLLQLRVKSHEVHPETIGVGSEEVIDTHFANKELEWRITGPEDVVVYGVLTRNVDLKDFHKKGYIKT